MFGADTSAFKGGGAVRHGALLLLGSAVRDAIRLFHRSQPSGAACKLALSECTMFGAETASCGKRAAPFNLAHFSVATTMSETLSPCSDSSGAGFPRADRFGAMLAADTMATSTYSAPFCRAESVGTMFSAKSFSSSVAAAT